VDCRLPALAAARARTDRVEGARGARTRCAGGPEPATRRSAAAAARPPAVGASRVPVPPGRARGRVRGWRRRRLGGAGGGRSRRARVGGGRGRRRGGRRRRRGGGLALTVAVGPAVGR